MYNHPDRFDPTAAEPPTHRDRRDENDDRDKDPDLIMEALNTMHAHCTKAKQHRLVMDHLSRLGLIPLVAPFNASIALTTDPEATYLATPDEWHRLNRAPKPGSNPISIQKALGPVSYVWDIRNTVKIGPSQSPRGFLAPPEIHRLTVTDYPASLDDCLKEIIKITRSMKSGSERKGDDADQVNMFPQVWERKVDAQVKEALNTTDGNADEKFGAVVRTCAALVLAHDGDSPKRKFRSLLPEETKIFEQAAVEWILRQVITNESVVPTDLEPYSSGTKPIPEGLHLKWLVSAASKFYGSIRSGTLPKEWSPAYH